MSDTFIDMIRNIDFLYGFIYECIDLIINLYEHNNYDHLVIKLCNKFILPIINITKNEHIKKYNTYIEDIKDVDNICSYLMNICSERYFKLSQNEYSKIKEVIDNNIDTVEAILAPMHEFFDLSKKCHDSYCYCPCNRDRYKGRLPAIAGGNAKVTGGKISNQPVKFPMFQIYSFSTFTRGGRKMYFYCYLFPKTSLSFYLLDDKGEGTRNKDTQYTFFFLCFLIFP